MDERQREALSYLVTRRSTRKYLDRPVEEEKLEALLAAGRSAPSGGNNRMTRFIVIRDAQILARLAETACSAFAAMEVTPGMYKSRANSIRASQKGGYVFHYGAPVLIVLANRKDYENNMADCSCAAENLMIAANILDLGSCWINQLHWLSEDASIRAILEACGLEKEETVLASVAVGYPDTGDGLPNRTPQPDRGNPVMMK